MTTDDPGLALERQMRRERNEAREAARKRAEHLDTLSDEDRDAFLAAEQQQRDEEAAEKRRMSELLEREHQERWHNEVAQYEAEAPRAVVAAWESVRGHRLSDGRRAEFLARDEVAQLAKFDKDDLVMAARLSMDEHDGELLLVHWLAAARSREAKAIARDSQPWWKGRHPAGGPY